MKVLHLLRSEPDELVERLIEGMTDEADETTVKPLFKEDVDWSRLVDEIFQNDKVISWW